MNGPTLTPAECVASMLRTFHAHRLRGHSYAHSVALTAIDTGCSAEAVDHFAATNDARRPATNGKTHVLEIA